jgi:hypothetical protein
MYGFNFKRIEGELAASNLEKSFIYVQNSLTPIYH